jgi:hypothetical protein
MSVRTQAQAYLLKAQDANSLYEVLQQQIDSHDNAATRSQRGNEHLAAVKLGKDPLYMMLCARRDRQIQLATMYATLALAVTQVV